MKNIKKIVLASSVLLFAFAILFTSNVNKVEAATCTAVTSASGLWSDSLTWTGCGGVPDASMAVIIPSGVVVKVDTITAAAESIIIDNSGASTGISINAGRKLTVTNDITLNAPSVASSTLLDVDRGTVEAGGLRISGGAAGFISETRINNGTLYIHGDISFSGVAAQARLTVSSNGMVEARSFGNGGTFTDAGAGTVWINGSMAGILGAYNYANVTVTNTSGGVTLGGDVTVNGNFLINGGTLDIGNNIFTVIGNSVVKDGATLTSTNVGTFSLRSMSLGNGTGSTGLFTPEASTLTFSSTLTIEVGGTITFNSATGTKTFNGNVTVNGIWNEAAVIPISFGGNLTNDGTFTAYNGGNVHIFTGAGKIIGGSVPLIIPYVTLNANTTLDTGSILTVENILLINGGGVELTNNGTINANSSLTGSGRLINGATGVLNLGDTISVTTLTATAVGNIVNYKGTNQTVKDTHYANLILSNASTKTISSALTIDNSLEIDTGIVADLTLTSTVPFLKFNNVIQKVGTWGATGSGALFPNDIHFTGAGKINATNTTVLPTLAVSLSDSALTTGETAVVTFTFSEVPLNFSNSNITVSNGTLLTVTVDPSNPLVYTAVFTPSTNKNVSTNTISVDTAWTDTATALNHPAGVSTSPNYTIYTIVSSGGSSGGGGGYVAPKPPVVPVVPVVVPVSLPVVLPIDASFVLVFTQPLKQGMKHSQVIKLQKLLNHTGYVIAKSGAGSPGNEINIFGSKTTKALMKFQKDNEMKADGVVGKMTRALLNEMWDDTYDVKISQAPKKVAEDTVTEKTPTVSAGKKFTKPLYEGMTDNEVITLQKVLNENRYVIADTGAGSPGNEINRFGNMTTKALMKFQKDNGMKADGVVGPKVRDLLNNL